MIIKELWLTHFGKFHDFHMEFGPSMNIISGGNEAGKSTVYHFIEAMFFGARRLRGRAASSDMYSRFQPWEGKNSYEGTMIFEHQGMTYRLYRNFYKTEVSVTLVCLDTNKVIPLPDGTLENFIENFTEENFENTIGVAQTQSRLSRSFARTLQTQAANMAMTGSSRLRLDSALEGLERERRRLRRGSADGELEALGKKETYCRQELEENRQRLEMLDGELEKFSEEDLKRKFESSEKGLESCQMAIGALSEKLSQHAAQAGRNRAPLSPRQPPLGSHGSSTDCPSYGLTSHGHDPRLEKTGSRLPVWLYGVLLVAGILTGVILAGIHEHIPLPALRLFLVLTAFLMVCGLLGFVRGIFEQRRELSGRAFDEERHRSIRESDGEEESHGREAAGLQMELARMEEKKRALEQRHKICLQALEQYRQIRERRAWEQEQYSRISNTLEDVIEEDQRLRDKIREEKKEELCVDTARKILEELAGEIHESFGKPLADRASELMNRITGEERQFIINEKLEMMVDNSQDFVPVSRLSEGALEQLYLAVRLGAAKLLFKDATVPLILDDTFAYYDDQRLRTVLSWFASEYKGQVIVLTCQHRECDILDGLNEDYNYVNLER